MGTMVFQYIRKLTIFVGLPVVMSSRAVTEKCKQ